MGAEITGETPHSCECIWWGGQWFLLNLHHESCPRAKENYSLIRGLVEGLLDGMDEWGHDEDGIHPAAVKAYNAACDAVGRRRAIPV
jgi:hypothetical protein